MKCGRPPLREWEPRALRRMMHSQYGRGGRTVVEESAKAKVLGKLRNFEALGGSAAGSGVAYGRGSWGTN